jgi:hypothetical protein
MIKGIPVYTVIFPHMTIPGVDTLTPSGVMVRCGWCRVVLADGPEPASHGICQGCAMLMDAQLAAFGPRARRARPRAAARPPRLLEGNQLVLF